jgi:hypothetical protein
MVGARVVSIGGALDELIEPSRPEHISHRHWNMLPNDIRNGDPIIAEIYVAGWEACLSGNLHVNPYRGIEVIQLREAWNRGYMACMNRRTRVYTERDMEYYHTEDFLFFDVSEERYGTIHGSPYKVMLFRSIEEGNTVEGQTIYPPHPMYKFPDVI